MAGESQVQKDDLITRSQYLRARLGVLWRYPTIFKTIKHIERIAVENRESWGSMLEETAAKFPDNAAVKSEDGNYSWKEYNLSLIHISEPTRLRRKSRMPSSA